MKLQALAISTTYSILSLLKNSQIS